MKKKLMMAMSFALVGALAFAQGGGGGSVPFGTMESFDLAQVSTTVVPLIYLGIEVIGAIFGALMGFAILRWGYNKIVGLLDGGDGSAEDYEGSMQYWIDRNAEKDRDWDDENGCYRD